jgi:hypothetical protein
VSISIGILSGTLPSSSDPLEPCPILPADVHVKLSAPTADEFRPQLALLWCICVVVLLKKVRSGDNKHHSPRARNLCRLYAAGRTNAQRCMVVPRSRDSSFSLERFNQQLQSSN